MIIPLILIASEVAFAFNLFPFLNLTESSTSELIGGEEPGTYSPFLTLCPKGSLIRKANNELSQLESDYVLNRNGITEAEFDSFTKRVTNFTPPLEAPTIAITMSGGGFRSMLTGAGVLGAYDSRTPGSESQLGGILQSSTYIAGISGGSWIVVNNLLNDGIPTSESINGLKIDLQTPVLEGVPNMDLKGVRQRLDENKAENLSPNTDASYSTNSILNRIIPAMVKNMLMADKEESGANFKGVIRFYKDISIEAQAKRNSGFRISVIDYWARTLVRKVFPKKYRSTGFTLSSATKLASFQNYSQLFPILTSIELIPNEEKSSKDSHIFEITPFEFGSWDSFLGAFMDIKYLGTRMWNGSSTHTERTTSDRNVCVSGYDTLSFLTATSSGLFNIMFRYIYKLLPPLYEETTPYFQQVLQMFGFSSQTASTQHSNSEYAVYSPNPFRGFRDENHHGRTIENLTSLLLADGGEDGQNIPFSPFLVPARKVDAILAFDMGSELYNRPNGSSLQASAHRYHANESELKIPLFQDMNGVVRRVFPRIFEAGEYLTGGYHQKPVFLGCDVEDYPPHEGEISAQFALQKRFTPPIIIYQANHDIVFTSNTSTFRTSYLAEEVEGMYRNGYQLAINGGEKDYPECVWCAVSKRKIRKLPEFCQKCFEKYCFKSQE